MSGPAFLMQNHPLEDLGEDNLWIFNENWFCIVNRFLPPVPKRAWSGEKDVRTVANSCVQIQGEAFGNFSGEKVIGWKKLYLSKVYSLISPFYFLSLYLLKWPK